jgi:hypothetical protein
MAEVVRHVLENHEPLRQVNVDQGISYETIQRLLRVTRKKKVGSRLFFLYTCSWERLSEMRDIML